MAMDHRIKEKMEGNRKTVHIQNTKTYNKSKKYYTKAIYLSTKMVWWWGRGGCAMKAEVVCQLVLPGVCVRLLKRESSTCG